MNRLPREGDRVRVLPQGGLNFYGMTGTVTARGVPTWVQLDGMSGPVKFDTTELEIIEPTTMFAREYHPQGFWSKCPYCGGDIDDGNHPRIGHGGGGDSSGARWIEERRQCRAPEPSSPPQGAT